MKLIAGLIGPYFSEFIITFVTILHRITFQVDIKENGTIKIIHGDYAITLIPFPEEGDIHFLTDIETFLGKKEWQPLPDIYELNLLGYYGLNRDLWNMCVIVRCNGVLTSMKNIPYEGFIISEHAPTEVIEGLKTYLSLKNYSSLKPESFTLNPPLYISTKVVQLAQ